MGYTAVIGAVFIDIKGVPFGKYNGRGTNLGKIGFYHGGVSRNIAENLGNIGIGVKFMSMADRTAIGDEVLQRLNGAGVDTSCVARTESGGMGMWLAVLNENGELAGSISQAPDMASLSELFDAAGDEIVKNADSVVLEIDISREISEKVFRTAEKYGKKVYAMVGNMGVILSCPELLCKTDCFICNEIEAGRLFGEDIKSMSPEGVLKAARAGAEKLKIPAVVVTLGENGAVYCDSRTGISGAKAAESAEIVDTTGAGDAFFAAVVGGLMRGLSLPEAVAAGTKLAAMTISSMESSCPKMDGLFKWRAL